MSEKKYVTEFVESKDCTGCCACIDACSKHKALNLETDNEGFWYPKVKLDACINCGLCTKVCPVLSTDNLRKTNFEEPNCYAAYNKNFLVRWDSTSGGLFSALADHFYELGGYVGGAVFNSDFSVSNFISSDPSDLQRLRSSKYVQSKAEGLFVKIKQLLKNGETVFVCGTPCQMAALRSYIGKEHDNLYIADFICRGVNSPKVYRKYLDSLEDKYNSKITHIKAKAKEYGWRSLARRVQFENGSVYYGLRQDDDFRRGYHTNVYCRPACYECKFKGFPRFSDISLGDFWGIENVDKSLDNDTGTSVVMINTEKGQRLFAMIKDQLKCKPVGFNSIKPGNIALYQSLSPSTINRADFFHDLDQIGFEQAIARYVPSNTRTSFKQKIKNTLRFYKKIGSALRCDLKGYINFIKLNYLQNQVVLKSSAKNYFFNHANTVLDLHKSASIFSDCVVDYGLKTVKGSNMESRLKMGKNSVLEFKSGAPSRYGDGKSYLIRCGADIQIEPNAKLTIYSGAANMNLNIMCGKEITIGEGTRIGRNVTIRDFNGIHVILDQDYDSYKPVYIGKKVWITSNVTIMPGVTIGDGAVIASNSVVTKDVPARAMVAGIPAKVVKENIEWY